MYFVNKAIPNVCLKMIVKNLKYPQTVLLFSAATGRGKIYNMLHILHTHIYIYTYIYIHMYICVCMLIFTQIKFGRIYWRERQTTSV